uniref:Uncharacterized protein n=1 Tax=Arundo donax TaxID=35708 RepID=A0A0A9F204_ARUDO
MYSTRLRHLYLDAYLTSQLVSIDKLSRIPRNPKREVTWYKKNQPSC